jgi:hypothetical protein
MDPAFAALASVAIGLLFAATGLHKLRNFQEFTLAVAAYQLFWPALARPAAVIIVVAELAVVAMLALPAGRPLGALLAVGLLLSYAAAMGINVRRGRTDLHCGCSWGPAHQVIRPALVTRNLLLAAAASLPLLPVAHRELLWLDYLSVAVAAIALALFYLTAEELLGHPASHSASHSTATP